MDKMMQATISSPQIKRAWLRSSVLAATFISSLACCVLACVLVCILAGALPAAAKAADLSCEAEILQAARRHNVPPGILYAVGLAETGRKGSLHAFALNIEGRAIFAATATAAEQEFHKARRKGARLIDLGCMQINHHYHGQYFSSLRQMLNPKHNVDYAAGFLSRLKQRHGTWAMAVARYHAGPDNDPAQKRYVCRVIANLAATGFGKWTPKARQLCNP